MCSFREDALPFSHFHSVSCFNREGVRVGVGGGRALKTLKSKNLLLWPIREDLIWKGFVIHDTKEGIELKCTNTYG